MIDFSLTEEQIAMQKTARKFALNEIRKVALHRDRLNDPETAFPYGLIKEGMQLGFGTIMVPEKYGGLGGNLLDCALITEELAYGDAGAADIFLVTMALSRLINIGANEAQKQRWLKAMCDDETGTFILGGPMTEPSGGSELFYPFADPKFGVKTTAKKDGDHYIINGQKCFITNAGISKLYIVLVRTNPDVPNLQGCSIFVIPEGTVGLSFGKAEAKMGHRLSVVREVILDNVRIHEDNMMGEEGDGFKILLQCYEGNGVAIGASAVGLARAAYDVALKHSQERIVWGQPIFQYDSVAGKLVDMRMKIEASRALIWKMAWAAENPTLSGGLSKLGSIAKVFPTSFVREITIQAMEILGGYGYMDEFPIEKYVRDSMLYPIYDGTNDVLKKFIGWRLPEVPSTVI